MNCPLHKDVAWQAHGSVPVPCFVCNPHWWLEHPPGRLPLDSTHNKTTSGDIESLVRDMLVSRIRVTA